MNMNLDMTSLLKYLFSAGAAPGPPKPAQNAAQEEELKVLDQGTELKEWRPRSSPPVAPKTDGLTLLQAPPAQQPTVPATSPFAEVNEGQHESVRSPRAAPTADPRTRAHAAFASGYISAKLPRYASASSSQTIDELTHLLRVCSSGIVPSLLLNTVAPGTVDERAVNTGSRRSFRAAGGTACTQGAGGSEGSSAVEQARHSVDRGSSASSDDAAKAGIIHDPDGMSAAAAAAIAASEVAFGLDAQAAISPRVYTPTISRQGSASYNPMTDLTASGQRATPNRLSLQMSGNGAGLISLAHDERAENWTLALTSARSLGCTMHGLTAEQLILCKADAVLSFLLDVIKAALVTQKVSLEVHPELAALRGKEEAPQDFAALGHEALLHRWVANTLSAAAAATAAARAAAAGAAEMPAAEQPAAGPSASNGPGHTDSHQPEDHIITVEQVAVLLSYLSHLPISSASPPIRPPDTSTPQAAAAAAAQLAAQMSLDLPSLQPSTLEHGGPEILQLVAAATLDRFAAISLPPPASTPNAPDAAASGVGSSFDAAKTSAEAASDAAGMPVREDAATFVRPSVDWGLSAAQSESPVSSGPAPARLGFRPTSSSTSAFAAALQAAESSSGASSRSTFSKKHASRQGSGRREGAAAGGQQEGADEHHHHHGPKAKEIWAGDDDDAGVDTQEERLLRAWLNTILSEGRSSGSSGGATKSLSGLTASSGSRGSAGGVHVAAPAVKISSLFEPGMRTGYPLLLACESLQPGCVRWSRAFTPPFTGRRVPYKLMCTENGNQVVSICTSLWHLPLVNIGGIDIAEGHRRAILALVWQMMRHHMSCLLGLITSLEHPSQTSSQTASQTHVSPSQTASQTHVSPSQTSVSGSRVQRQQIEEDVLRWANEMLAASGRAHHPAPPPLTSFADPRLAAGQVLLQLLSAMSPRAVIARHVLPGETEEERESNAKWA